MSGYIWQCLWRVIVARGRVFWLSFRLGSVNVCRDVAPLLPISTECVSVPEAPAVTADSTDEEMPALIPVTRKRPKAEPSAVIARHHFPNRSLSFPPALPGTLPPFAAEDTVKGSSVQSAATQLFPSLLAPTAREKKEPPIVNQLFPSLLAPTAREKKEPPTPTTLTQGKLLLQLR